MKALNSVCLPALFFAVCFCLMSCGDGDDDDTGGGGSGDDSSVDDDAASDCENVTTLFSVGDLLESGDGNCFDWVLSVYGRAILDSIGTAAVFTRDNQYNLGLMFGAVHTLGEGYFGTSGTDLPVTMSDPSEEMGVARLSLIPQDGSVELPNLSAMFFFYHPEIPAAENGNQMRDILPRHDFYITVVDSQLFAKDLTAPLPGPLVLSPLPLFDPQNLTLNDPEIRSPEDDEIVLFVGYPREGDLAETLAAGAGRTLSDEEAEQVIAQLKATGDVEGDIDYDEEAEFLIEGESYVGMSGSAVFDRNGNQIGVLVRASDVHDGIQYLRAVRTTFIMDSFIAAFDALAASDQEEIEPFMPDL